MENVLQTINTILNITEGVSKVLVFAFRGIKAWTDAGAPTITAQQVDREIDELKQYVRDAKADDWKKLDEMIGVK